MVYYLAAKTGFVCTLLPNNNFSTTCNIKYAVGFHTFDIADIYAKTLGLEEYAILTDAINKEQAMNNLNPFNRDFWDDVVMWVSIVGVSVMLGWAVIDWFIRTQG